MIQFRVGHQWKHEEWTLGDPRDSFIFELDGISMLPGANDEPLVRSVTSLVDAVSGLVANGERAGQLSLEHVHLELCFWRTAGHAVQVTVIDLSSPPRIVRGPVTIELDGLVEAVVRCARGLLRDVDAQRGALTAELVSLEKKLKRLTGSVIESWTERPSPPWSASRPADAGVGFNLYDDEGCTLAWTRKTRAGLPPLLFGGTIVLSDGDTRTGPPFLTMMGLARAATESVGRTAGTTLEPAQVFSAGLDLCLALRTRNPALGSNPYVEALQLRCTDGLTALRQAIPDTTLATLSPPRASPGFPLVPSGIPRRVRLEPRWERPVAIGEEGGRLMLGPRWVTVASPHAAHVFTKKGATASRFLAVQGVAAAPTGEALCASADRLQFFEARDPQARWFRHHEGPSLSGPLDCVDDMLITRFGRRGLAGIARLTGREVWRFEPPRTQVIHVARVGHRLLVGTDEGVLHGLDVDDGQERFRLKAELPVVARPLVARQRALVLLNRGEHTVVYACEAFATRESVPAGALAWTRELVLSTPTAPVTARGRTWLGGQRDGRTVLVCLGARGQVLFEKTVRLDARTLRLLPFDGGVIVADARGVTTRLLPDGSAEWVLGASGDELNHPIALTVSRKTLIVPGPVTRLVQPQGGRVLGELATGPHLIDLAVDAKLNLYVLKEPGILQCVSPGATLAVVG